MPQVPVHSTGAILKSSSHCVSDATVSFLLARQERYSSPVLRDGGLVPQGGRTGAI